MTGAAVFLVSAAALAYEIVLVRVFALGQWNHLSFMVISIALMGFAVSGTVYCLVDARSPDASSRLGQSKSYCRLSLLFTLSAVAGLLFILRVPLDYFRLPFEPLQWIYLFGVYVVMALPFFSPA